MQPSNFSYESMGTKWQILIWDVISDEDLTLLKTEILKQSEEFNQIYSRFLADSFVTQISTQTGEISVPEDFVTMLRVYQKLNIATNGKVNPLIGFTISDLGYDATYSLKPKEQIRITPNLSETVSIVSNNKISITTPVLFDFGALGKGYFVEKIKEYLIQQGYTTFLVDGSGDTVYVGEGGSARIGLEDPADTSKVIGVLEIQKGAVCASANNKRKWGGISHTIDPDLNTTPKEIQATWVWAQSATEADGLATALFFTEPEELQKYFEFEYCLMNNERKIKRSAGFTAELF